MDSSATTRRLQHLSRHFKASNITTPPVRVTVTGAAGNIGYALVHMIGQGRLLGPNQQIILTLLELPMAKDQLEGTMMELRDCAFPILKEIRGTTQYDQGFMGCEIAILVGAKPRGPGMERKDLLAANAHIFKNTLAKFLRFWLQEILPIPMPQSELNSHQTYQNLISQHSLVQVKRELNPSLPKGSVPMLRMLETLSFGVIITLINLLMSVKQETVQQNGISQTVRGLVANDASLQQAFVEQVAKRGGAIIQKRKAFSAASAASAVCDHIHDWLIGTDNGIFVSMGVVTDGKLFGIKEQV